MAFAHRAPLLAALALASLAWIATAEPAPPALRQVEDAIVDRFGAAVSGTAFEKANLKSVRFQNCKLILTNVEPADGDLLITVSTLDLMRLRKPEIVESLSLAFEALPDAVNAISISVQANQDLYANNSHAESSYTIAFADADAARKMRDGFSRAMELCGRASGAAPPPNQDPTLQSGDR